MPTATESAAPNTAPEFSDADIAASPKEKMPAAQPVPNVFVYNAPLRTANLLSQVGLMSDDQLTEAGWLKRITRAIARDYNKDQFDDHTGQRIALWQQDFQKKLATMDYEKLVTEGHVNKMVENYLAALADYHQGVVTKMDTVPVTREEEKDPAVFNRIHDREKALAEKYRAELRYVHDNADAIKAVARKYPQAVKNAKDIPFGKLVVEYGLLAEKDKVKAADMMDDVLATGVAHTIKVMSAPLADIDSNEIKSWAENPKLFETQIRALSDKLRRETKPLSYASLNSDTTPELGQIQGLRNLLSAELNAALDPKQSPAELATALANVEPLIQDYRAVTMSLAYHFLGKGPSAGDARMQALQGQIKEALGDDLLPFERAEAKAVDLARTSAQDLVQTTAGKPELEAKLKAVLGQINPELASEKLEAKPGLIGGTVQATIGAFLKLGEQLKSMLGMKSEGAARGAA